MKILRKRFGPNPGLLSPSSGEVRDSTTRSPVMRVEFIGPIASSHWNIFFISGQGERHRSRPGPELRLRQQQRHRALGRGRRGVRQTGRGQSARRQQQQVQHLLGLRPVRRLTTSAGR